MVSVVPPVASSTAPTSPDGHAAAPPRTAAAEVSTVMAATPARCGGGVGLGTTDHCLPSQCSVSVEMFEMMPVVWLDTPTAHTSDGETALAPTRSSVWLPGALGSAPRSRPCHPSAPPA